MYAVRRQDSGDPKHLQAWTDPKYETLWHPEAGPHVRPRQVALPLKNTFGPTRVSPVNRLLRAGLTAVTCLVLMACQQDGHPNGPDEPEGRDEVRLTQATVRPDLRECDDLGPGECQESDRSTGEGEVRVMEVTVGPQRLDCVGWDPGSVWK